MGDGACGPPHAERILRAGARALRHALFPSGGRRAAVAPPGPRGGADAPRPRRDRTDGLPELPRRRGPAALSRPPPAPRATARDADRAQRRRIPRPTAASGGGCSTTCRSRARRCWRRPRRAGWTSRSSRRHPCSRRSPASRSRRSSGPRSCSTSRTSGLTRRSSSARCGIRRRSPRRARSSASRTVTPTSSPSRRPAWSARCSSAGTRPSASSSRPTASTRSASRSTRTRVPCRAASSTAARSAWATRSGR